MPILTVEICLAVILRHVYQIVFSTKRSAGACDKSNLVNVLGRSKKCDNKVNKQTGQQEPAAVVVFKRSVATKQIDKQFSRSLLQL